MVYEVVHKTSVKRFSCESGNKQTHTYIGTILLPWPLMREVKIFWKNITINKSHIILAYAKTWQYSIEFECMINIFSGESYAVLHVTDCKGWPSGQALSRACDSFKKSFFLFGGLCFCASWNHGNLISILVDCEGGTMDFMLYSFHSIKTLSWPSGVFFSYLCDQKMNTIGARNYHCLAYRSTMNKNLVPVKMEGPPPGS